MKWSILILLLISSAWVHAETFEISKGKKISINLPSEWEGVKDLFGLPLTVLGPWENESRPAMSFTYTGMVEKKFTKSEFEKLFADFKSDKQNWVNKHKGELLQIDPLTEVKAGNKSGYYIGSEFKINDIHFIERSYYLACNGEIYNVKYSIRDEHKKHLKGLTDIVENFKCE